MIETFGSRLKQLRSSKNIRQEQLGKLVGVNKTAIHYYENDMRQPPYETLIRLASIFNVTTDYLLGCEKKNVIDVSGLTTAEMSLIRSLVDNMVQKNMRLEGRIYMIGGQDD